MNSNSRTRHAWTAGLVVLLATSQTAAQTSVTAPASESATEARTHFGRGVTFYDEADYSAALVEFSRAYAIAPTWQVLFNIGQSYFQIHDYARALVTLKRFVDEGQDRIPPERRALVDAERTGSRQSRRPREHRVQRRRGATIRVDDVVVGVAVPLSEPVLVSVGVRKISATVAGREPVEQEASVPVGETVDVRLDFSGPPAAQAAPTAAPAPAPMRVERSATPRNLFFLYGADRGAERPPLRARPPASSSAPSPFTTSPASRGSAPDARARSARRATSMPSPATGPCRRSRSELQPSAQWPASCSGSRRDRGDRLKTGRSRRLERPRSPSRFRARLRRGTLLR